MNDIERTERDLIENYLTPSMREKAPEGFTSKVMATVRTEKSPAINRRPLLASRIIPIGIPVLLVILTLVATTVPTENIWSISEMQDEIFGRIGSLLPEFSPGNGFTMEFPAIILYITVSVFLLFVTDYFIGRRLFGKRN